MYCPGSSRPLRTSSSQLGSSTSGARSMTACWGGGNSEGRTNSVPPQLGQAGSSTAASSDTGKSQSVQRKVPVPATLPVIQAFIDRLLATDSGSSVLGGSQGCVKLRGAHGHFSLLAHPRPKPV